MKQKSASIRYTVESNSYLQAKDWQGQGQPELKRVTATSWRVIVNDPARCEACEIHAFDTKAAADAYISEQQQ